MKNINIQLLKLQDKIQNSQIDQVNKKELNNLTIEKLPRAIEILENENYHDLVEIGMKLLKESKRTKRQHSELMTCPVCGREIVKIRPCMYCENDKLSK